MEAKKDVQCAAHFSWTQQKHEINETQIKSKRATER